MACGVRQSNKAVEPHSCNDSSPTHLANWFPGAKLAAKDSADNASHDTTTRRAATRKQPKNAPASHRFSRRRRRAARAVADACRQRLGAQDAVQGLDRQ